VKALQGFHPSRRAALRLVLLTAAFPFAIPASPCAADPIPLSIKGYDPVAYFTDGKAVAGLADVEYEWDERRYRFARPEHRELFKADPMRYAPQFANFCAMALGRGVIVEADPEHWLVSDGKLYLFAAPTGVAVFQQNKDINIDKANQNRKLLEAR
jgi:YHS domain-containing protein